MWLLPLFWLDGIAGHFGTNVVRFKTMAKIWVREQESHSNRMNNYENKSDGNNL